MIMSSPLGLNSEVSGVSSALRSENSSHVDAAPTHLYFLYSYTSSRPDTGEVSDP